MADRKDSVALRSGNSIQIRERAGAVGARHCRFISYALLQPKKDEVSKAKRRRKARPAA